MTLTSKNMLFKVSKEDVEEAVEVIADDSNDTDELEQQGAVIEQDVVTIENNIQRLNNVLEAQADAIQQLDEAHLYNRSTQEIEDTISEDTAAVVTEHYVYCLGQLGCKLSDLKYVSFSKEDYTPKQRVQLSLEGIIDTLKEFFKKIIDIIVKVGKELGIWINKFVNFIQNERRKLDAINVFCHDNQGIKWQGFNEKNTAKIQRALGAILLVTNGKVEFNQIIDYYTTNAGNPFATRINEVYKLTSVPDSASDEEINDQKEKLVQAIKKDSCSDIIHKGLIEQIEKQEGGECYYVSIAKGETIKYYGKTKDAKFTYGLPLSYNKCVIRNRKPMNVILPNVNTYGDIPTFSRRLYEISRRHNEYFNTVLKLNKEAIKLVKQLQSSIMKENELDNSIRIVLKRNLSFLQSLGTSLAFDSSWQYGYLTRTLTNILKLACNQKTDNSVENKLNKSVNETEEKKEEAKPAVESFKVAMGLQGFRK